MQDKINIQTKEDAKNYIVKNDIKYIQYGLFDLNGILRGKTVSQDKFLSMLENGGSFYDGILAGDINDGVMDCMQFTGDHTGFPDAPIEVLPNSARIIPWDKESIFFLCQFSQTHSELCPRSILQRVINKATEMGFHFLSAMEYEFSIFDEIDTSLREKQYSDLNTFSSNNMGYSIQGSFSHHELHQEILSMCEEMNFPLEALHTEVGHGMLEAALIATNGIKSADNASLFKLFMKVLIERNDMTANFMAKWNEELQGHGAHIHLSLYDKGKHNVFYDPNQPHTMSQTMCHFLAGQQALMPEFLALCAPTINSYTRYIPGYWAPTEASWGYANRAVSLRVIEGSPKTQRIEYRVAGADCNPYLAFAAAFASGLYGIENKLKLSQPFVPGAKNNTTSPSLPTNLRDATQLFANSSAAKMIFGDAFVTDYAASRQWEVSLYEKAVTDWQLKRYFENA